MPSDTHHSSSAAAALARAATAALRAPSILNSQPWRWRLTGDHADLVLDRSRVLPVIDPEERMATISCGAALHHLCVALVAEGVRVEVTRLPDIDTLARVRVTGRDHPDAADMRRYQSLLIRRTDRRPFGRVAVPPGTLDLLRAAAESRGAHLHIARADQVVALTVAAERAAVIETGDPAYRAEAAAWTHRGTHAQDGVPPNTLVPNVPRRIPLRDLALGAQAGLAPGADDDAGTTYALLYADTDDRLSWLRTGEALGAVLLSAVEHGLSASPMSDLVEVESTRHTLRRMLSGLGEPMLVLRIGVGEPPGPVPATPRRAPNQVIERIGEQA